MLFGTSLALVVAGLAGATPAGQAQRAYENPTPGAALVYQIPGMHRAQVIRNRVYSRAGGGLRMDIYRPRSAPRLKRLPIVLLGGPPAYAAGRDSGQKIGWAQLIAASGMAAAAFDIRSDHFLGTPYDPSRDVAAAIHYVRGHSGTLRIDPHRICTLGFSLGTAPWHLWATMKPRPAYVRCNAVYYGPLDFDRFDDVSIDPKYVREFSAITYLRRDGPKIAPMLVAAAGRDRFADINTSIDRFAREAAALHAPVNVLRHPAGSHGFDLADRNARSRTIIKATLAFFRASLDVRG